MFQVGSFGNAESGFGHFFDWIIDEGVSWLSEKKSFYYRIIREGVKIWADYRSWGHFWADYRIPYIPNAPPFPSHQGCWYIFRGAFVDGHLRVCLFMILWIHQKLIIHIGVVCSVAQNKSKILTQHMVVPYAPSRNFQEEFLICFLKNHLEARGTLIFLQNFQMQAWIHTFT